MVTDEIKTFIAKELQEMAEFYIKQRISSLQGRKINATNELAQSLDYKVVYEAKVEVISMLLAFEEHGRYVDMKRLKPPTEYGAEYITAIEEWIKARGWEDRFIRKFVAQRKLREVPKDVLNQIAWGIAAKRGSGKYRRRKWYNSSKTAMIYQLFNDIAAGLPQKVQTGLAQNMQQIINNP